MEPLPQMVWFGLAGTHGAVQLIKTGDDVFLMLTADLEDGVPIDDRLFARLTPGRPAEFTADQLRDVRDMIGRALDLASDGPAEGQHVGGVE